MNTSENEMKSYDEPEKDGNENDGEPIFNTMAEGVRSQRSAVSFNYSARKKIEEYLENKILIKLTYDTFDD